MKNHLKSPKTLKCWVIIINFYPSFILQANCCPHYLLCRLHPALWQFLSTKNPFYLNFFLLGSSTTSTWSKKEKTKRWLWTTCAVIWDRYPSKMTQCRWGCGAEMCCLTWICIWNFTTECDSLAERGRFEDHVQIAAPGGCVLCERQGGGPGIEIRQHRVAQTVCAAAGARSVYLKKESYDLHDTGSDLQPCLTLVL